MPLWTAPARRLALSPPSRAKPTGEWTASRKWHAGPRQRWRDGAEMRGYRSDDRSYTTGSLDEGKRYRVFGLTEEEDSFPPASVRRNRPISAGRKAGDTSSKSSFYEERPFAPFGLEGNENITSPGFLADDRYSPLSFEDLERSPRDDRTETDPMIADHLSENATSTFYPLQANAEPDLDPERSVSAQSEGTIDDYRSRSSLPESTEHQPPKSEHMSADDYPFRGQLRSWTTIFREIGVAFQQQNGFRIWLENVILLHNRYSKNTTEATLAKGLPIVDVRTTEWVEEVLEQLQEDTLDLGPIAQQYNVSQEWVWIHVSLWMLAHDPGKMALLLSLSSLYVLPWKRARDALSLVAFWQMHPVEAPAGNPDTVLMANVLCKLLKQRPRMNFFEHWSVFRVLIRTCSHDTVLQIHDAIQHNGQTLGRDSRLQFASHFARHATMESFDRSLESLVAAQRYGVANSSSGGYFWTVCWKVLRSCMNFPDGLRLTLRAVDDLAKAGVILTEQYRDMVMVNAADAGDAKTVFSVYRTLAAEASMPTEAAFHALVLACQSRISNAETMNGVVRSAIAACDVRSSPMLAGTILFTLLLHLAKRHPTSIWPKMVDAYLELFDPAPLQKISLSWSTRGTTSRFENTRMAPTRYTLAIMVRAYLQHTIKNKQKLEHIYPVYVRWLELARSGDEHFAPLLNTDHMFNNFLEAFIESKETLPLAAQVVRDMFSRSKSSKVSEMGIAPVAPTRKTWNILHYGFARHGLTDLAEQVLTLMRAAGHTPTVYTYTPLIDEFTRTQHLSQLIRTLIRMEDAGVAWDEGVNQALSKFEHQDLLRVVLRRVQEERAAEPGINFEETLNRVIRAPYGWRTVVPRPKITGLSGTAEASALPTPNGGRKADLSNFRFIRETAPASSSEIQEAPALEEAPSVSPSEMPKAPALGEAPSAPLSESPEAPGSIIRWIYHREPVDEADREVTRASRVTHLRGLQRAAPAENDIKTLKPPSASETEPEETAEKSGPLHKEPTAYVTKTLIKGGKVGPQSPDIVPLKGPLYLTKTFKPHAASESELEDERKEVADRSLVETWSTSAMKGFRPVSISNSYRTGPDGNRLFWISRPKRRKEEVLDRPFVEAERTPPSEPLLDTIRKFRRPY